MNKRRGITLIELLVVIVVVTILASISYLMFASWQQDRAQTQVKNELTHASNALKNFRNFNPSYPTTLAPSYQPGADVTLVYTLRADGTYCLVASSQKQTTVVWNIDSRIADEPRVGQCTP